MGPVLCAGVLEEGVQEQDKGGQIGVPEQLAGKGEGQEEVDAVFESR